MTQKPDTDPAVTPARRARGEATRTRLIGAARALLSGEHEGAFTTRNVATLAGVTHGMCHYHFHDRTELILAVIDDLRAEWITPLREAVAPPGKFLDRAERLLAFLVEPESSSSANLFSALHWLAQGDSRIRERLAGEYQEWREGFIALFRVLADEEPARKWDAEAMGTAAAAAADGLAAYAALGMTESFESALRSVLLGAASGAEGPAARRRT